MEKQNTLIEQLQNGYRMSGPKDACQLKFWKAERMYNDISDLCFAADPIDRASFYDIVRIIQNELSEEEIVHYNEMKGEYQSRAF